MLFTPPTAYYFVLLHLAYIKSKKFSRKAAEIAKKTQAELK
jgi:hypothetical protein